jgi:hypothetical protein
MRSKLGMISSVRSRYEERDRRVAPRDALVVV